MKIIARNKRAGYDYDLSDKLVAGLQLVGSEVKSVKAGHISLKGAYVRFSDGALVLTGAHVSPYLPAGSSQHEPTRDRRLLLHQAELKHLTAARTAGRQIVPLAVGLTRGFVKLEIGLGSPRKKYDKRAAIKAREATREINRQLKG